MRLSLLRLARVKYYANTQAMLKEGEKLMDEKNNGGVIVSLFFAGVIGAIVYLGNKHAEPPKKVEY
ncbi:unnamed protein product [Larinioides sclopetarius]|uniref:Uncharacterized protein n=1 Tax=Larinioides sclopetarius TaxID=280406 RepID=A0AAV1Z3T2_9ARAC